MAAVLGGFLDDRARSVVTSLPGAATTTMQALASTKGAPTAVITTGSALGSVRWLGCAHPQSPEFALFGEGGVIGDGPVFGLFGEAVAFLVGFGLGLAGVLADAGVLAVTAVGAVFAVRVAVGLGLGLWLGEVVGEAGAVAPTTIAGCGSAVAGEPEFMAIRPRVQVPTPRVPETAQAIAALDSGMAIPSSTPAGLLPVVSG
jgi:hypothetical protein